MRKLTLIAALAAVLIAPTFASASGPGPDGFGFRKRSQARAGPWFLYWPYGAYFQTPAPTGYYGGSPPLTLGPYQGQIGPVAVPSQRPTYPGPTGYDY